MRSAAPSTYGLITPARDEAENVRRLAECLIGQTLLPSAWVVVDNGSRDGTPEVVASLAEQHGWIRLVASRPERTARPGRPIVEAFHAGLRALPPVDVVVKLDADVSVDSDYFERLLQAFSSEPELGIASGQCYERNGRRWLPTHVTGDHVRGATRAWRRECLDQVLPLDGTVPCVMDVVDELKARRAGWRTGIVPELRFYHHRGVGERDGGSAVRWARQGRAAHYVGYRLWYLAARAVFRARRNPAALAMVVGYLGAVLRREPRCADPAVIEELRRQQALRSLPVRMREALGRRPRAVRTI